jgi:hypothetical protein
MLKVPPGMKIMPSGSTKPVDDPESSELLEPLSVAVVPAESSAGHSLTFKSLSIITKDLSLTQPVAVSHKANVIRALNGQPLCLSG